MNAGDGAAAGFGILLGLVMIAFGFAVYMLPTFIAFTRKHHQVMPIALINVFFGWTLIGWFGSLVWAVSAVQRR